MEAVARLEATLMAMYPEIPRLAFCGPRRSEASLAVLSPERISLKSASMAITFQTCEQPVKVTIGIPVFNCEVRHYYERMREDLRQPEGNAAPWKYRVVLRCFGFSAAESCARIVRTSWKGLWSYHKTAVRIPGTSFVSPARNLNEGLGEAIDQSNGNRL